MENPSGGSLGIYIHNALKENLKKNPVIVLSEKTPISLTTKMIEKVKKAVDKNEKE